MTMKNKDLFPVRVMLILWHTKNMAAMKITVGAAISAAGLTLCLVAAGVVAKKMIAPLKVEAEITEIGGEKDTEAGLQKAITEKDSVGGIVECRVSGFLLD